MHNDRNDLLVRAAELYYQQDVTQGEIATILRISRPTVSRLLEEAREKGVVEIVVHSPIRKDPKLSRTLRDMLKIRDVIVVGGTEDPEKALDYCCDSACGLVNAVLSNNFTLGITWGSVVHRFCEMMPSREYYNVNIVQMVGCLGTGNPYIDGMELTVRLSQKLGGTYSNICAPVYVNDETVYKYLMNEHQISASLRRARHADIVVTGIGSLDDETILKRAGYLSDKERKALKKNGAVGHLLARPFDKDGKEIAIPGRYILSATLESLRSAQWSIGIAVSESKAEAAIASCRSKYINTLVISQNVAERMLFLLG